MVIQTRRYTVEEFDEWVMRPENADHDYEYIGGEIVEVVSNNESSEIAAKFVWLISNVVIPNKLGRVTGADGGYIIGDQRYLPDVAYISAGRQPEPCREAYNPNAPDLAVEVISPTDSPSDLALKVSNYNLAGVTVWVADPAKKIINIHPPAKSPNTLTVKDTLTGGDILPGFAVPVRDIFPE
jgi:Uma2 family endonuclease